VTQGAPRPKRCSAYNGEVATSRNSKKRAARRRAHEARASKHATAASHKDHSHLPHSGTPENQEYLRRRHLEDLVAFGEFRSSRGPAPVIVAVVVGVLFAVGVLAWVLLL
jgi:ribosomal protein L32